MQRWNSPHHDVRRVPAYTQPVGCVYADRRVYAPDAAFTHMCLYAVVRAFTRAVGAYTHLAYMYMAVVHPGVYTQVGAFLRLREWLGAYTQRVHICTPGCVRGTRVGASLTARAARVGRGRRVCPGRDENRAF